jgi:hypothetical protein
MQPAASLSENAQGTVEEIVEHENSCTRRDQRGSGGGETAMRQKVTKRVVGLTSNECCTSTAQLCTNCI